MPARISKDEFESEVIASALPVLVDFYSDSCVPCKMISPLLSQLEEEYAGKVKIVKVNSNFEDELVEQYGISAAPTLVVFKDGAEVVRRTGAASKEDIKELFGSLI